MQKKSILQKGSIDYSILIVTLILIAYGAIMVFSASYYMAQASKDYNYDGLYLFKKQLFGAAIGLAAMIFFTFFDYKKLFKLLIDRDMKKKELAEKAGISIATITKMGKDGAVVSSEVLVKICSALGCTMDDIVEIIEK